MSADLQGFDPITSLPLPLDGTEIAILPLRDPAEFAYRLVVEGTFTFDYDGKTYDALYTTDAQGRFSVPHNLLQFNRPGVQVVREDPVRHRYIFEVSPTQELAGQSLGVRLEVDRFVDWYLIPPSQVKAGLSGDLRVAVWEKPLAPPLTPLVWSPLAVLAVVAVGWVIRRRMVLARERLVLDADLQAQLQQIAQKYEAVQLLLNAQGEEASDLRERFARLYEGAVALAQQTQILRNTVREVDEVALHRELTRLERNLARASSEALRRELAAAVEEKRRVARELAHTQENETRTHLRLSKIEALFDAARLKLPNLQIAQENAVEEQRLIADVEEELAVLEEVVEELRRI